MDISSPPSLTKGLDATLSRYRSSFADKVFEEKIAKSDPLMEVFGLTPEEKSKNPQYWGRELGKMWELLVLDICLHHTISATRPSDGDERQPCDVVVDGIGLETKYRSGSGDTNFQKKIRSSGKVLAETGLQPILLFFRDDNLPQVLGTARRSGWLFYQGEQTFDFIRDRFAFDIAAYLRSRKGSCRLDALIGDA